MFSRQTLSYLVKAILPLCWLLTNAPFASFHAQQLELVVQTGHSAEVFSVAFSPNGKQLVSSSWDHSIKLWNAETGAEIRTLQSHSDSVSSVAFSPDGKQIVSGSLDKSIKLWNAETGAEIRTLQSHSDSVSSVAFSPDGKQIVSGSLDKSIKIWNAETGAEIRTLQAHSKSVQSVAFSPDGKQIASGGEDNSIKIWNAETGAEIKTLQGHSDSASEVAFSPNGKQIVSNNYRSIKIWNLETGKEIRTLTGHEYSVLSVSFSPNGKQIVSGGADNSIKIWNAETGKEIKTLTGHSDVVYSVAFSPDGKQIASGSADYSIKLWNAETGKEIKTLTGHSSKVESVAFSPNGKQLVSSSWDYSIKLWNAETGKEIRTLTGHSDVVYSVAFSPDGKQIASGSADYSIKLWNAETGKEIKTLTGHSDVVYSVAFSPDGKQIASGSADNSIKLWNAETGAEIKTLQGYSNWVSSVAFSPDGKQIVSDSADNSIKLWNAETGIEIRTLRGHSNPVQSVAFSPNGKQIVSGSSDDSIKLWNSETGAEIKTLQGHSNSVQSVAFSPDGKQIVSGSLDYSIKIWNTENGAEMRTLSGHSNWVSEVAFSPDRKQIVSGSWDTKTKIWDAATGKELASLIAIDEKDWVVIDLDGRFDASEGALKLMHYSYGMQTIDLEQFKDEYFEPGLLQKIFNRQPLRAVVPLADAKLPPEIIEQKIAPNSTKLNLKLKNRGGGFGEIRIFVNDKLAVADARDANLKANPYPRQEFVNLTIDLKDSAFVRGKICEDQTKAETCRDNKISVVTSNYLAQFKKSNITSRGSEVVWLVDDDKKYELPTLYAIVGGVSDYTGDRLDLNFAAKDAEDFSNALRLGATRMLCPDKKAECLNKINITTLSTSGKAGTILPTKENFRREFARIAYHAKPEDIVLVYLSGHGVSLDNTDTYFYLTQDASSTSKEDLQKNFRTVSITSDELLCWLSPLQCEADRQLEFEGKPQFGTKALKQVIILDTCASGKAGAKIALTAQKDLTTDQRRAIEFLKDKSGTHILMGSTADAPSYEATPFGQGLLTYSLLAGMRGAALQKPSNLVDVRTLFDYSEKEVPNLAKNIGGIQRPTIASPTGKTFVIGQMTTDETANISLPQPKPYVLRPSFGNKEMRNRDNLKINEKLAQLLDDESRLQSKGEQVLVYLDEDTFPGAIQPTGFYVIETNGNVRVEISLWQDDKEVLILKEFTTSSDKAVAEIMQKIREALLQIK